MINAEGHVNRVVSPKNGKTVYYRLKPLHI